MVSAFDRPGTALVDRYTTARELASGGLAMVYLRPGPKAPAQSGSKVLRPELPATLGAERFVQEIETAAKPHFDSGEAGGVLYTSCHTWKGSRYASGWNSRRRRRRGADTVSDTPSATSVQHVEQASVLDDQGLVIHTGDEGVFEPIRLVIDNEEPGAGGLQPTEPHVGRPDVGGIVELHQRLHVEARSERVGEPGPEQIGREAGARQVDVVVAQAELGVERLARAQTQGR